MPATTADTPKSPAREDNTVSGHRSWAPAAHLHLTGEVFAGADYTLNPYPTVRGTVTLREAVRVGGHTSLLGFDHSTAPDRRIHQQPMVSRGITVGGDGWTGSHVVVLDGVTIKDHCVIGAGTAVPKDLPTWAMVGGTSAPLIRDDRQGTGVQRHRSLLGR